MIKNLRLLLLAFVAVYTSAVGYAATDKLKSSPSIPLAPTPGSGECYKLKEVDVQPNARNKVAPTYPAELKKSRVEGTALIECVVNVEGHPTAIRVVRATNPAFGEAGVEAIKQWVWSPAMKFDKPVACRLVQPFEFKIIQSDEPELITEQIDKTSPVDPSRCYDLKDLDVLPRTRKRIQPVYPPDLKKKGISGEVVLECVVDVEGHTTQIKIIQATDPAFGKVGIEALEQWEWVPGQKNDQRVPCRLRQPFSFATYDE